MTSCDASRLCIRELTSENYLGVTQQSGEMVVVLHYSGNCAACSSVGHVVLMTAHVARHLPNVTFARINVLHNTLPWHLTFHSLPTIIVHPHFRKGDSQVFDSSQALTPASLLTFLVTNMEARHRLALALDLCNMSCQYQVLQQITLITTRLHHSINQATVRLHHILAQMVRVAQNHTTNVTSNPHYRILQSTKLELARELRMLRLRLHHLDHIQKLIYRSAVEGMPNSVALLESFQYLIQKNSYSPEEWQSSSVLREE